MRSASLLTIVAVAAAGVAAETARWTPAPVESMENRQKASGLAVAAQAFTTDEQTKGPFGKLNPNHYGVLPVLLALKSEEGSTIRLENLRISLSDRDGQTIEPTPATEVKYVYGPRQPKLTGSPIPGLNRKKKNPLAAAQIEERAWAAKMLPPGESAQGFFYFQTRSAHSAKLIVSGLEEARTGKELIFFELPLD